MIPLSDLSFTAVRDFQYAPVSKLQGILSLSPVVNHSHCYVDNTLLYVWIMTKLKPLAKPICLHNGQMRFGRITKLVFRHSSPLTSLLRWTTCCTLSSWKPVLIMSVKVDSVLIYFLINSNIPCSAPSHSLSLLLKQAALWWVQAGISSKNRSV